MQEAREEHVILITEGHASQRWIAKAIELNRHTTCMKIRRSMVSLSFSLPHPPEDICIYKYILRSIQKYIEIYIYI